MTWSLLQVSDFRIFAAQGLSQTETAARLGISPVWVCVKAKRLGVKFKHGNRKPNSTASAQRQSSGECQAPQESRAVPAHQEARQESPAPVSDCRSG